MSGRTFSWLACGLLVLAGLTAALSLNAQPPNPPTQSDGPYVSAGNTTRWVARSLSPTGVRSAELRAGNSLIVPSVGSMPAFRVRLREPVLAASEAAIQTHVPLFIMADTHGELEIAVTLLQRHGVIDRNLRWSFGRGHLVVTGDMLDRGANQIELLWLLYELERQAQRAGGAVHVLIGNHEAMVLRGDLRYLHPRYLQTAQALGASSYSGLLGPRTVLGQWLRTRPTILKLGDMLFLHGGISPGLTTSGLSLEQINSASRESLDVPIAGRERLTEPQALVVGPNGPLWYRGYFPSSAEPAAATAVDVEASLAHFGVRRIFVGHTPVDTVTPLYNGQVVAVQVYPRRDEETGAFIMEGALRERGIWYRASVDGTREALGL